MGLFKPIETTKANIGKIKVTAGQMISCSDTGELYFDTIKNGRQSIADLIIVENDAARTSLAKPLSNKLYLVKDTNYIWRYDGTNWNQLTFSKPSIRTYSDKIVLSKVSNDYGMDIPDLLTELLDYDPQLDYLEIFLNGILTDFSLVEYTGDIGMKILFYNLDTDKYITESDITYKIYKNCGPSNISRPPV